MELNPKQDSKIDKYALDEESANIASLIQSYDELWDKAFSRYTKLKSQFENLQDDLKEVKAKLAFKLKTSWGDYGFDKSPSDKVAENWGFTQEEYLTLINKIKLLREEMAEQESIEHKYKNFHYVLLEKSKKIDQLKDLFFSGYYVKEAIQEIQIQPREEGQEELNGLSQRMGSRALKGRRKLNNES